MKRPIKNLLRARSGAPVQHRNLREVAELCGELLEFEQRWGRDLQALVHSSREREFGPGRIPLKHLGFEISHVRRQTGFVPDLADGMLYGVRLDPDRPLDFVGRLETLEEQFDWVQRHLGMPDPRPLRRSNAAGNGRGPYPPYFDGGTRRLVEELYAADLERFGYRFEDGLERIVSYPSAWLRAAPSNDFRTLHTNRIAAPGNRGLGFRIRERPARLRFELTTFLIGLAKRWGICAFVRIPGRLRATRRWQ